MTTTKREARTPQPGDVPHSWPMSMWPVGVFPNDSMAARNFVRMYRDELVAAGALTRVGRRLVVLGAKYDAWLRSRIDQVDDYESPFSRKKKVA